MSLDDAWVLLEKADKEKEVEDIRLVRQEDCFLIRDNMLTFEQAILQYAKAYPEVSFEELETVFREANFNTYLIAKKQDVASTHTIVNLRGIGDQSYVVSIQFSAKPKRAKFSEGWPGTPEENLARLAEAGFIMDRMVPKCDNCGGESSLGRYLQQPLTLDRARTYNEEVYRREARIREGIQRIRL